MTDLIKNMITIEQYNEAVQVINKFHEQMVEKIEAVSKTTIRQFLVANKDIDARTRNALHAIDGYYKKNRHIMYIEDLDRAMFLKPKNVGGKAWENFVKVRGY
mgnify:CR=1 FL=1